MAIKRSVFVHTCVECKDYRGHFYKKHHEKEISYNVWWKGYDYERTSLEKLKSLNV